MISKNTLKARRNICFSSETMWEHLNFLFALLSCVRRLLAWTKPRRKQQFQGWSLPLTLLGPSGGTSVKWFSAACIPVTVSGGWGSRWVPVGRSGRGTEWWEDRGERRRKAWVSISASSYMSLLALNTLWRERVVCLFYFNVTALLRYNSHIRKSVLLRYAGSGSEYI